MTRWLDRLPLRPETRLPAICAAVALTVLAHSICCSGGLYLWRTIRSDRQTQRFVTTVPLHIKDLPPDLVDELDVEGSAPLFDPSAPQDRLTEALGADASELLLAAAADAKGRITLFESSGGQLNVSVGARSFCKQAQGREAARWRAAVVRLEHRGLIEYADSGSIGDAMAHLQWEHMRLTVAGYQAADAIQPVSKHGN